MKDSNPHAKACRRDVGPDCYHYWSGIHDCGVMRRTDAPEVTNCPYYEPREPLCAIEAKG